jgi:hypothetical protein
MSGRHVFGYYPLAQQPFPCPPGLEATQGFSGGSFEFRMPIQNGASRSYEDDSQGWISVRHHKPVAVKGRK